MNDYAQYVELCKNTPTIPLFMQNWWLDAVHTPLKSALNEGTRHWQPLLAYDRNGIPTAAMIVAERQRLNMRLAGEPHLTPFSGIWQKDLVFNKIHQKQFFQKSNMQQILEKMPDFHFADFRFHFSTTDMQPFIWAGFEAEPRYTYLLSDISDTQKIREGFNDNTRRNIGKAQQQLTVSTSDDLDLFLSIAGASFERQNIRNPTPLSIWQRLDPELAKRGRRAILTAHQNGALVAAIYIVFDNGTAYYLAGGANEIGRRNGAMHLLLWRGIEAAASVGCQYFDFEGSMLPNVEAFFRGFGAEQKVYFRVRKAKNSIYKKIFLP